MAFTTTPTPLKSSFKPAYNPTRRSSPSNNTRVKDIAEDNYFIYHKPGHRSPDCLDRDRLYDPHSYERDPRVHEIAPINETPDSDYQEDSENDEPPLKTR